MKIQESVSKLQQQAELAALRAQKALEIVNQSRYILANAEEALINLTAANEKMAAALTALDLSTQPTNDPEILILKVINERTTFSKDMKPEYKKEMALEVLNIMKSLSNNAEEFSYTKAREIVGRSSIAYFLRELVEARVFKALYVGNEKRKLSEKTFGLDEIGKELYHIIF